MINIEKGRYWDEGITLVDGCAPCSPGCAHCWSAAQRHRFYSRKRFLEGKLTNTEWPKIGQFNGNIITHSDRLSRFNKKKPTVFAVRHDLFRESVSDDFYSSAAKAMMINIYHTYLLLTKRPQVLLNRFNSARRGDPAEEMISPKHIYFGLTVCNQQEWDKNKDIFLQVPGKKFVSHEPALERISYGECLCLVDCLISGGETGSGARPSHPNIFRSDRDQCAAAGVPFFFKQWGEWAPARCQKVEGFVNHTNGHYWLEFDPECGSYIKKIGRKKAGRLLDGRTHDELPWRKS